MTSPTDPTDILGQINSARDQTYQNIATAQGILDQANAAASAAARDRAAIQAIAQQTVRVDTSVGTRVFAGDTMIFGDTGPVDVTNLLEGYDPGMTPRLILRRVNDIVLFSLQYFRVPVDADTSSPLVLTKNIPYGFGTGYQHWYPVLDANSFGTRLSISGSTISAQTPRRSAVYLLSGSYSGVPSWPTSLPGAPA